MLPPFLNTMIHATSVLSFPNANEKVYFNPYIYAKSMKKPLKLKNILYQSQFFRHVTIIFIEKYLPQFSYALILQANAMECKYSQINFNVDNDTVYIKTWTEISWICYAVYVVIFV